MAGFINWLYLAVGPNATLFTRQIHSTTKARSRWDCSFSISVPLLEEKPLTDTGFSRSFPPLQLFLVMSVAGGFQIRLNDQPVSGMFTPFESQQSSTFRELNWPFFTLLKRMLFS